ncbi:glycosyltransferase [Pseudomonas piscis]|uniref:glycosyltransferase n=1 Tax=Pseudomonas piscis TaxID=2614538 RepID=UPI001F2BAFD1|nr:glycosyltransferase [Pseudomonas piscis]
MSYLILIVIYKVSLKDSQSIRSLVEVPLQKNSATVVIWDNSPEAQSQEQLDWISKKLGKEHVIYQHTPENKSLSEIYNSFIKLAHKKNDFIILLDQDTSFDYRLFTTHQQVLDSGDKSNLYLPIVKFKEKIVSPGKQILFKSFPYKNIKPGLMASKNNTAINSG